MLLLTTCQLVLVSRSLAGMQSLEMATLPLHAVSGCIADIDVASYMRMLEQSSDTSETGVLNMGSSEGLGIRMASSSDADNNPSSIRIGLICAVVRLTRGRGDSIAHWWASCGPAGKPAERFSVITLTMYM